MVQFVVAVSSLLRRFFSSCSGVLLFTQEILQISTLIRETVDEWPARESARAVNLFIYSHYFMNIWEKRANYLLLMTFKNLSNDE